ncbi:hypothetical protein Tco_0571333, partial [Tanacetum coccineum]
TLNQLCALSVCALRTQPVCALRTQLVCALCTPPVSALRTQPVSILVTALRTQPVCALRTQPVSALRTQPVYALRTQPVFYMYSDSLLPYALNVVISVVCKMGRNGLKLCSSWVRYKLLIFIICYQFGMPQNKYLSAKQLEELADDGVGGLDKDGEFWKLLKYS